MTASRRKMLPWFARRRFHVVSRVTDALDQVRREAWAEAHRQAKTAPKRGKGHPAKGTEGNAEKTKAKRLKNTRYALLKNPENLSDVQKT